MMKKFKQKSTGIRVVECSGRYVSDQVFELNSLSKEAVENSSDWEEIEELCVPIGTKFRVNKTDSPIYTIEQCDEENVNVKSQHNDNSQPISIKWVNSFFKKGAWIKVEEGKNILLTTEDGVDIHMGDQYWFVGTVSNTNTYMTPIKNTAMEVSIQHLRDNIHTQNTGVRFSTKELAEQYIEENKPQYSLKDIERAFNCQAMSKEGFFANLMIKPKQSKS